VARDHGPVQRDPIDRVPVGRPSKPSKPSKRSIAASILMAAMFGLADALGWERTTGEIVEVADAPSGGDGLDLRFGLLPPLDDRR